MKTTKLKVMPCPVNAGRHPYHDSRWIATEGATVEFNHDRTGWKVENGILVAQMMDVDQSLARLLAAAPELLKALELAVKALNTAPRFKVPCASSDSYKIASVCDAAIAKAKGT